MQKTKYKYISESPQKKGEVQPSLELPYPENADLIDLPAPHTLSKPSITLSAAIEQRVSVRKYSQQSLTLEELSFLLWSTQGIKEVVSRPSTKRTVPSAGARHAFETFLLINNVEGLNPGLYRFISIKHALLPVDLSENITSRLTEACMKQKMVTTSAITFIWAAITERMTWRYVERGYRYLHLDAGHVCQNLYLAGEGIECGTCAIAAFDDDLLNECLSLDGEDQFAIYVGTIGKKV
ncbi:MAG: SagB/ThcOx family dehydrogenase [Anaerolineaceae bacterium]|nr:SagB/ThcOx family dehydrogenase [Anaerolineaceae bacterium]